jgi:hypothetical protein
MFTYGNNNFYGAEFNFLQGKWFGYYVNVSLAGTPENSKSAYSANNFILDISYGIGFLPRFWRFYIFLGVGISYNIAMRPFDLGFGLEYRGMLGFMITENVGINIAFRRNLAMYLLGISSSSSSSSSSSDLPTLGGTYISIGVNF